MNFFGHAAVAAWHDTAPEFVLGAMLPDFASMLRARPPEVTRDGLAAGVALHHRTDLVFHDCGAFRALTAQAFDALSNLGLGRGSARAVAHIGVEILLDGVLAHEQAARRAYLAALEAAVDASDALVWRSASEGRAFAELLAALRSRGISRQHTQPAVVAYRVERALAGRPRLALVTEDVARVERWADTSRGAVLEQTPFIVEQLRLGLEADEPPVRG
ncbi:MAG: hypothetical protein IPI67_08725 [Myxococcales bacterium]|nr:hypothetical protein [Myxococcales bacterium]